MILGESSAGNEVGRGRVLSLRSPQEIKYGSCGVDGDTLGAETHGGSPGIY